MENINGYDVVQKILPSFLSNIIGGMSEGEKSNLEEIRLRIGRCAKRNLSGKESALGGQDITYAHLNYILERATEHSIHSYNESIKQGYITIVGGNRIGICGEVIVRDGQIYTISNISSMNIRISRQIIGIADNMLPELCSDGYLENTLIISPPGLGKTTLLRDMIRILSNAGYVVGVADDRMEISASYHGVPQFNLGEHTDVMVGFAKADSLMMLLRTMSPRVLAFDEITSIHDIQAIKYAGYCGASIITTAHAYGLDDLKTREIYRDMMDDGLFKNIIFIFRDSGGRHYKILRLGSGGYA